jgi:hypothetical protein
LVMCAVDHVQLDCVSRLGFAMNLVEVSTKLGTNETKN